MSKKKIDGDVLSLTGYIVTFGDPEPDGSVFTPETDFGIAEHEWRPLHLGVPIRDLEGKRIGQGEVAVLARGLHVHAQIERGKLGKYADRIESLRDQGVMSVCAYCDDKTRIESDGQGHYTTWPVTSLVLVSLKGESNDHDGIAGS